MEREKNRKDEKPPNKIQLLQDIVAILNPNETSLQVSFHSFHFRSLFPFLKYFFRV